MGIFVFVRVRSQHSLARYRRNTICVAIWFVCFRIRTAVSIYGGLPIAECTKIYSINRVSMRPTFQAIYSKFIDSSLFSSFWESPHTHTHAHGVPSAIVHMACQVCYDRKILASANGKNWNLAPFIILLPIRICCHKHLLLNCRISIRVGSTQYLPTNGRMDQWTSVPLNNECNSYSLLLHINVLFFLSIFNCKIESNAAAADAPLSQSTNKIIFILPAQRFVESW